MITPLGRTVEENFDQMHLGNSGVQKIQSSGFGGEDWPLGKIQYLDKKDRYNDLLSRLCDNLLEQHREILSDDRTLFVVSSTKGNVAEMPTDTFQSTRTIIQEKLNPKNPIVIISNACISGVLAINTAVDYIESGKYDNVVTIGIDVLSDFIVYGFQSLFAMSDAPSAPFSEDRKGISLGEAAGSILVSKQKPSDAYCVEYLGGSSSNDANHISGPSRTGEGLYRSIIKTGQRAGVDLSSIEFISAHGTGTIYNDEMESIAFDRLGLNNVPMNSLKGYFGHTLGAAGIIELLSCMLMMENGLLLKSLGFKEKGTSKSIEVLEENKTLRPTYVLKTASGFGGGNASIIIKKSK